MTFDDLAVGDQVTFTPRHGRPLSGRVTGLQRLGVFDTVPVVWIDHYGYPWADVREMERA